MYSRFVENKHVIEKESGFSKRTHGLPLYLLIVIFIFATGLLCLGAFFFSPVNWFFLVGLIVFVEFLLAVLIYHTTQKDRNIMHLLELQNALFSGAARLASEFCIILKYDGTVIYVDPQYNNRFFHLKNQGMSDLDALCESGKLTPHAKKKLMTILKEGRSGSIEFTVPVDRHEHALALSVDPIGIYHTQELSHKLTLAIQPSTRPSGYFFLRSKKTSIEDEYRECLQTFGLGYFSLTDHFDFLSVNGTFSTISGYTKEELITGQTSYHTIFSDKQLYDPLNTEKTFRGITTLQTKHHGIQPVFLGQILVQNPHTGLSYIHGIIYPLTHKLIAYPKEESSLLSSTPDLLEGSPLATVILDQKGTILKYNTAFKQTIEKMIPAALSQQKQDQYNIMDWIEPAQPSKSITSWLEHLPLTQRHTPEPLDIHFKQNSDQVASLYLNALPVSSLTTGSTLFIGHLVDTTELKKLELHLAHSQKMQAIGQLAGGIAHDFNNLLTAMIGFSDLLLLRHPSGDPSFSNITQIRQNANRAANLVRQLLAFSRKQTLQPKIINITDILADLSHLIRRLIGENLTLKMIHGRDLGQIRGDQGQLEQVIINLAVNARDAMPTGGTLTLKTSNVSITDRYNNMTNNLVAPPADEPIEEGNYVLIEITDTGQGMSKELLPKIFEPFFSTKETGAGTGLGLSTVYGIVKQTNGYIYVSSTEQVGTSFFIFLKHYDPTALKEEAVISSGPDLLPTLPSAEEPLKADLSDLTGRGTILLVEDEAPVRIFSSTALSNKGYSILEADCAETALQMMKEHIHKIDVIITDVVMPGMNGPSMIKEVVKDHPHIKVIFVSGYGEDEFIRSFGEDRNFNFLSKPYTLQQLATKVKQVIGKSKTQ